jgi:PAS domain S-box-containing protein
METALECVFDATSSSLVLLDETGHIVLANRRLEAMFGYPRPGLIGCSVNVLLAKSSQATLAQRRAELIGERSASRANPTRIEQLHVVRRDGTEFVAALSLHLVENDGQRMLVASVLDDADNVGSINQFALALEAAPTGMLLADREGRIVYANGELARMFGYEREELVGFALDRLVPQPHRAGHALARKDFFENAQPRPMGAGRDLYGVRKDGRQVPVEIGLNAVALNDRKLVLSSVVDITERKRAQSHFRVALDAAPTGMLLVNEQGLILLVNTQIETIFGSAREELIGRSLEQLVPMPLRSKHEAWRQGFFEKTSNRPMGGGRDLYGLHRDGHAVPVEIALTTLDAAEGRLVLTSVIDITERKRVELALRETEQRYSELFSDSPVALFEQDFSETRAYLMDLMASGVTDIGAYLSKHPDAVLAAAAKVKAVMMNQHALRLLEAKQESELRSVMAFFCQETFAWFQAGLCELLAGARYFSRETRARTLTGRMLTVSKQMHLLPGHRDTWSRVVVSLFDLTAHDRAEQLLRSALRDKEVLLREVHHRVKNNLQIVSSLLSLKGESVEDLVTRQMFADCQHRVRSLAFVHEHLYLADDLAYVPFDRYLRTMVEHLKLSFRGSVESITSQVDAGDISLSIDDAIPCGLIINELVTNSLKHAFSPNGCGHIRVRMRKLDAQHLELVVSDNGRGLPPGFEPLDSDSSGLELVYTFVEQLQAEVEVSSVAGTTFTLRFTPGASARARAEPA